MYLSNQDLYINGNLEFSNNIAENGGGIFVSDHSNVIFHKNTTVSFTSNIATNNGGAIFLTNHSSVLFSADHSSSYQCYDNEHYDTLEIGNNYPVNLFTIIVKFYNNKAFGFGQDIYAYNSNIIVDNNAIVTIDGKEFSLSDSSAIHTEHYSTVMFKGNSTVTMNNNKARSNGGAVYGGEYSTTTFKGNSTVTFNNSKTHGNNGGAIYSFIV